MSAEAAARQLKRYRDNPATFVHEELKVEKIDDWQLEVLKAFPSTDLDKQRISMQACAGPGKTAVEAWCGWNFLACYGDKDDHPKGAAVSITGDNLADNLWPEFSKWQERSEYLRREFTWTKSRIFCNDHPSTWFLAARSFSKTANAEEQGRTLSGLHSKYVLALIDESGDIPPAVAKAAEQALSTKPKFGKVLQAGNPTSLSGMLYAAAGPLRHLWYIIRITGDPDDPRRSPRIDIDWAREQIATYGRDNPWVMSFILGLFPPGSVNQLISVDVAEEALTRHLQPDAYNFSQKRLGIDVARFGDDRTVIFPRQGLASFNPVILRNMRNPDIAARVSLAKNKWGAEMEFVDGTAGFGGGVVDSLMQAGYTPQEIHFSGKAVDPRYYNKRAEMWFSMAEWLKRGSIPNLPELVRELTAPTYSFKDGKFLLEPKEMIKKRLGFSPDIADALGLTFALPDMPASPESLGFKGVKDQKILSDYDPFADV
jgi:phage terminase large subunit